MPNRLIRDAHTLVSTSNSGRGVDEGYDFRWQCSCGSSSSAARRTIEEARQGHLRHYQRLQAQGMVRETNWMCMHHYFEMFFDGRYRIWRFGYNVNHEVFASIEPTVREILLEEIKERIYDLAAESDPDAHEDLFRWRVHSKWRTHRSATSASPSYSHSGEQQARTCTARRSVGGVT